MNDGGLSLEIPPELVERIAGRAAELVASNLEHSAQSPYLTVAETAAYLRTSRQRVYDLCSSGRLTRHKDGTRVLVSRAELDAYLAAGGRSRIARLLPPARQPGENTGPLG
jgi:excisionase family DNA binding protein